MTRFKIVEDAKRQALSLFVGIAVPCQPSLADGVHGPIRSEKILPFNRAALLKKRKVKVTKTDSRMVGGDDRMIVKMGKPGSRERVEALAAQYAILSVNEESAFQE